MLNEQQEGLWSELRFEEAALSAFSFLVHDYNFRHVATAVNCISYASDAVVVHVVHDPRSFEVSAAVALVLNRPVEDQQETFSVWEVARLAGAREIGPSKFLQASTKEQVAIAVSQIADALARYGDRALRGETVFFRALREQQQTESAAFLASGRAAFLRQATARAWNAQDYAEVVRLLSDMPGPLSAAEAKKLELARRQVERE